MIACRVLQGIGAALLWPAMIGMACSALGDSKRALALGLIFGSCSVGNAAGPIVGGALTQWHIHDNLCFANEGGSPIVAGLTQPAGTCRAPLCTDNVKNGTETDVDCGGSCPTKCHTGDKCKVASDCDTSICDPTASAIAGMSSPVTRMY